MDTSVSGNKSRTEMYAEFLREMGVLVLVFYPLEMKQLTASERNLIILVSFLCLFMGVELEKRRRQR